MKEKQLSVVVRIREDLDELKVCSDIRDHIRNKMDGVEFIKSHTKVLR